MKSTKKKILEEFYRLKVYIDRPELIIELSEENYKKLLDKADRFLSVCHKIKKKRSGKKLEVNQLEKQVRKLRENAYIYRIDWKSLL